MKVQIFSDLHVDVHPIKPITIVPGVDVVIVAGDVCEGMLRAFEQLRRIVPMDIPIVMVPGNHEFYRKFISDELAVAFANAGAFNLHFLNDTAVELGGIRFLGAALWTDYRIFGEANQTAVMSACAKTMNDHRLIGWQKQPWLRFRPQEAALLHHQSKAFLAETLAVPFAGPTVVVSHHAVHWDSIHPRFRNDPVTGAFVSNRSELIDRHRPTLWVHGHVHNTSDYLVGSTRVLCNPHGYGSENPNFNPALVVELKA
jgi:Icc-related predicted phosphoesterase